MTLEIVVAQPALLRVGRVIVDRDGRACPRLEATPATIDRCRETER